MLGPGTYHLSRRGRILSVVKTPEADTRSLILLAVAEDPVSVACLVVEFCALLAVLDGVRCWLVGR